VKRYCFFYKRVLFFIFSSNRQLGWCNWYSRIAQWSKIAFLTSKFYNSKSWRATMFIFWPTLVYSLKIFLNYCFRLQIFFVIGETGVLKPIFFFCTSLEFLLKMWLFLILKIMKYYISPCKELTTKNLTFCNFECPKVHHFLERIRWIFFFFDSS
jgi:hypothetical protein